MPNIILTSGNYSFQNKINFIFEKWVLMEKWKMKMRLT